MATKKKAVKKVVKTKSKGKITQYYDPDIDAFAFYLNGKLLGRSEFGDPDELVKLLGYEWEERDKGKVKEEYAFPETLD